MHRRFRPANRPLAPLEQVRGDGVGGDQNLCPLQLLACENLLRLGIRQSPPGLFHRRGVSPRIDNEEQVAFLDGVAIFEVDGVDVAADAGPQFDGLDRVESSGERVAIDDDPFLRRGHFDCRGADAAGGAFEHPITERAKAVMRATWAVQLLIVASVDNFRAVAKPAMRVLPSIPAHVDRTIV